MACVMGVDAHVAQSVVARYVLFFFLLGCAPHALMVIVAMA